MPTLAELFTEPSAKEGRAGFTVNVKVLSAIEPLLSALIVKEAVPTVLGVPEITFPEADRPPV
jgi:hypothetical protein